MYSRITCRRNSNKIRGWTDKSGERNIPNWNSIGYNVGHVSAEWLAGWLAHQFSSMQERHTNTPQKMFNKQNLIKILIMRATRRGTERATRPLPLRNKNTLRFNCDCTHH